MAPAPQSEVDFLRALCAHALANSDPFSRGDHAPGLAQTDLERLTGMSRPSVVNLIRRFEGVLEQVPPTSGGAGRIVLNPMVGLAVGVDFGHGHTSVALSDLYGRLLTGAETQVESASARGPQQVDWAAAQISGLLTETELEFNSVAGVGIALPGPLDRNDEYAVIRAAASLGTAFQNPFQSLRPAVHLKEALVKRAPDWRKVPFFVDNDANLSALAQRTWGLARDARNVIYLDWSSGIGGGIILNGEIYRGEGAAGELGHIIVADATESRSLQPCQRCGNAGCLESVASFEAIESKLREEIASCKESNRVSAVISLAADNGPALKVLRQAADYITRALAPLITALNPQLVIIGGGFGTQAYDVIKNDLLDGLDQRTMPPANKDVTILGAIPPRLEQLPGGLRAAARRTALTGAVAAIVNPTGSESDPVISYLRQRA